MRYSFIFLFSLILSCQPSKTNYSGEELLNKSIQKHDPNGEWSQVEFTLRIQEPRLQNPVRFSEVYINNETNEFKLLRNREDKIASYSVNKKGESTVLLDNQIVADSLLIQQYLLQKQRVKVYQNSYQTMLGLPMSLTEDLIDSIGTVSQVVFNERSAHKIELKLKKRMFSEHWNVYLSSKDFTLLGVDLFDPEDSEKGERLYFDKNLRIGNISIPRMKHWYDLKDTYLGSDIIVEKIQ